MKTTVHSSSFPPYSAQSTTPYKSAQLTHRLSRVWQAFIHFFSGKTDIKIWQVTPRHGDHYWRVYDPVTQQCTNFASETEVRQWLEQRYYQ